MKLYCCIIIVFLCISSVYADIEYHKFKIRNNTTDVVIFNPSEHEINVNFALGTNTIKNKFSSESFKSYIKRTDPVVAINGPYYNPVTKMPVSSIVVRNNLIVDGLCHSMLIVDDCNNASIKFFDKGVIGRA